MAALHRSTTITTWRFRWRTVSLQVARALGDRTVSDARLDKLVTLDPADVDLYLDARTVAHPGIEPYRGFMTDYRLGNLGKVVAGDWDLSATAIDEVPLFRLLHDRFVLGHRWDESPVFQDFVTKVEAGGRIWQSRSVADLNRRAAKLDRLFEVLRRDGFRSDGNPIDVIAMHVGRSGAWLFCNTGGHHRFYMARILGIRAVPALVLVRHADWQAVRDTVRRGGAPAPASLDHPDLADVAVRRLRVRAP